MSRTIIDYQIWDESKQRPEGGVIFRQEIKDNHNKIVIPNVGEYIDIIPTTKRDSNGDARDRIFGIIKSKLIQHYTKDFGIKHNEEDNCYVNIVIELIKDNDSAFSKLIKE